MTICSLMTATALLAASPLLAQQAADPGAPRAPLAEDRGYDKPDARTDAINAPNQAALAQANDPAAQPPASTLSTNEANQAQYDRDMQAYRDMVHAHNVAVVRDNIRYERQQRAYADAMRIWRIQTAECQHGNSRACKAPPPDPADFY